MLGLGLWAGTRHAAAQGFIRHFDLEQNGYPGAVLSVKEVSAGYLLFCSQVSADGTNRTHPVTRLLNAEGMQISEQVFFAGVPRHYVPGNVDPIATCADGNFAVAMFDQALGFDLGISLFRYDQQGDTLSTHSVLRYPIEDSMVVNMHHLRQCMDGGFFMVGELEPYVPQAALGRALLVRTNSFGDTLWTRRYGPGFGVKHSALGVVEYEDGGAIVIGERNPGFVLDQYTVMRTNAVGDELWTRYFGNKAGVTYGAVRLDNTGQILTYSPYREASFPTYEWAQFMFTKWSPDGDIVWQKKSHYGYLYTNADFEILPDNSIIAVGKHVDGAELMKFSSEGDSLWTRLYVAFESGGGHYLWDVQVTSDGGFIAAGSCEQELGDPTPFLETEWVLKTDSLGCVVPGCHTVGVQEYALDLNELLRIAPNPVHDVLSAELPLPPGAVLQGAVRAVLLNAQGQQVQVWPVRRSWDLLSLREDVSALPRGMYYLHLADEKRWLAGGKVMVE